MRKKRVKILKKLIVITAVSLMIIPSVIAIVLGFRVHFLKKNLDRTAEELNYYLELQSELAFMENDKTQEDNSEGDGSEAYVSLGDDSDKRSLDENSSDKGSLPIMADLSGLTLGEEELYDGYRKVYLTFDDGPSANTEAILDILKEYDVKATFFVIKKEGRNFEKLYQRIVDEGHSLGMHSCTHEYSVVYGSRESFIEDTKTLRDFLYMVTGVESNIYRFPGGSSNRASRIDMHEFGNILKDEGINYFDWNVSSQDASAILPSKEQIFVNSTKGLEQKDEAIILFHDLGSKVTTVEALPQIIEYIQAMDKTVLLPITSDTNPIQHLSVK